MGERSPRQLTLFPLSRRDIDRAYKHRHREKIRARGRAHYGAHRDERREANQRWYAENPDKSRELSRRKMAADPDRYRAIARRTYERNRATVLQRNRERYYLTRSNPDVVEWIRILLLDPCVYCGAPAEHVDHIDAVALGGTTAVDNLTAACASCNCSKQTDSLLTFMLRRIGAT